jgi:YjbE family integral membrane protein
LRHDDAEKLRLFTHLSRPSGPAFRIGGAGAARPAAALAPGGDGAGRRAAAEWPFPPDFQESRLFQLTLLEPAGLIALGQVLMIDIVLAGDNAVVIGMAAARVPEASRNKVILWGLAAAVVLRLGLAAIAVSLLNIIGLRLAGGILLLWVCWRFWRDISGVDHKAKLPQLGAHQPLRKAVMQIVLADISMSLDNVLAVAGASRGHLDVLAIGLLLSVALMGVAANLIARLLERWRWISYVGLLVVLYVAASMIWHGGNAVLKALG